ncbi:MAG: aldo/keto reductase [Acidimicrobiia bacterium]
MTSLPTNPLGRTGMNLTRVGFGAWAIGGEWLAGWGPQDDAESIAAIRHAIDAGINWIDTAPAYGLGHSEEVAAALRGVPQADRPYVFTKAGLIWDEALAAGSRMEAAPSRSGTVASIRREVEASLRRLQVEQIDLYQMHWPAQDASLEEYWGAFADLQQEGKVRAIGLSNHDVAQLEAAEAIAHVDSLQPPLSPVNRAAGGDVVPWCAEHGTGVIVYSPMASGLLSGSWSRERTASLDAGDWRRNNPLFSGDGLEAALDLVDRLRPVAEEHKSSVGSIAIAWTLAFAGVTGAIVGARTPAQIDGWIDAATLELGAGALDAVAAAIETSGVGAGPARPGATS